MRTTTIFAETYTSERANHVAYRLVSKINYQNIVGRPPAYAVRRSEIMHYNTAVLKLGSLKSIRTAVTLGHWLYPKHFNKFMITASKFVEAFSSKTRP